MRVVPQVLARSLTVLLSAVMLCAGASRSTGSGDTWNRIPDTWQRVYNRQASARNRAYSVADTAPNAVFTQVDERRVKVSGSRFIPDARYRVKLEGAEKLGFRSVVLVGIRDPFMIAALDLLFADVRERAEARFGIAAPVSAANRGCGDPDLADFSRSTRCLGVRIDNREPFCRRKPEPAIGSFTGTGLETP